MGQYLLVYFHSDSFRVVPRHTSYFAQMENASRQNILDLFTITCVLTHTHGLRCANISFNGTSVASEHTALSHFAIQSPDAFEREHPLNHRPQVCINPIWAAYHRRALGYLQRSFRESRSSKIEEKGKCLEEMVLGLLASRMVLPISFN